MPTRILKIRVHDVHTADVQMLMLDRLGYLAQLTCVIPQMQTYHLFGPHSPMHLQCCISESLRED